MGISKDQQLLKGFPLEDIKDKYFEWFWVDFNSPTAEEELLLDTFFHFHPLAIEDCLMRLQRPKLDFYDDYHFFVIHRLNEETLIAEELNIFVSDKFIVTYHKNETPEIDKVQKLLEEQPKNWERGTVFLTYQTIDKIVDSYFPLVYKIEDHLNTLEDELTYQSSVNAMQIVFEFRSDLLHLRRTILPMRDLLYRVLSSYRFALKKSERAYFGDIHDHLVKLTEIVESNRELTADMRDNYMAMSSSRMNGIMMTLTIVSTIFIPLTFIAGVYGMNFDIMPELHGRYSYFIVLGIMILIVIFMLSFFKYKGWFKLFKP
ncbi:magnesium and cobalt transport protein CorA [Lysinibacillus sphaericus OT4b.31]|uniref:Magnesium transport protein CorA n=2 Tax=Lysinibacillus sphaericus TaxID=1421 RepID=R7ZA50_LYSSH|nr:magnesium/cobalt transporter CorA [Lysinibacillus sphaericus]EON71030.1 magnesium and cobalt transport protein CorA [Lysinibacillus sphaericus OT4b.31]